MSNAEVVTVKVLSVKAWKSPAKAVGWQADVEITASGRNVVRSAASEQPASAAGVDRAGVEALVTRAVLEDGVDAITDLFRLDERFPDPDDINRLHRVTYPAL